MAAPLGAAASRCATGTDGAARSTIGAAEAPPSLTSRGLGLLKGLLSPLLRLLLRPLGRLSRAWTAAHSRPVLPALTTGAWVRRHGPRGDLPVRGRGP